MRICGLKYNLRREIKGNKNIYKKLAFVVRLSGRNFFHNYLLVSIKYLTELWNRAKHLEGITYIVFIIK